jgi:aminopeptidase N
LALSRLLVAVGDVQRGSAPDAPVALAATFRKVLADAPNDPAFAAEMLALPAEGYVGEQMAVVDPDAIHAARVTLRRQLAQTLKDDLLDTYRVFNRSGPYRPDPRAAGERGLKNACLSYLMELDDAAIRGLCLDQFDSAANMTDAMVAVTAFANTSCSERADVLARFYAKWKDEPLVVDKWLTVQATSRLPGTLAEVKSLTAHPAFDLRNPNKVYALLRAFSGNQVRFNAADGGGYAFMADQVVALDPVNPQVAARLARAFDRWRKYDAGRQEHARTALERVRDTPALSKETTEVVSKALA